MDVSLIEKCERLSSEMNELGFLLMRPFYEEYGINYLKLSILREILDSDALTLNVLANRLSKAAANLSVVITTMEEEGYIKRVRSVNDGRVMFIRATDKGRDVSAASYKFIVKVYGNIFKDSSEMENLVQALEVCTNRLLDAVKK